MKTVLVVDDSAFFRKRIESAINKSVGFKVVATAANGREAVELCKKHRPNVITMDIEMPEMDGITAVRHIMDDNPTPILMFSSLTTEGASATIESLEAGAVDFIAKTFQDIADGGKSAHELLINKIESVSCSKVKKISMKTSLAFAGKAKHDKKKPLFRNVPTFKNSKYDLIIFGTSTGGPIALQSIFSDLAADFPCPILVVQHMPGAFTSSYAKRLNNTSQLDVVEVKAGDEIKPGYIYIAPGGKQCGLVKRGSSTQVRLFDESGQIYKPSVDITLESISHIYKSNVLVIILTGMGSDGCIGCQKLKSLGATIWAQDEASCVVYGMPAAVVNSGVADKICALDEISQLLSKEV